MTRKGSASSTVATQPDTSATLTEEINTVTSTDQPQTLSRTSTEPTDGPGTPPQTPSKAPKIDYADLAAVSAAYQAADASTKAVMRKLAETSLRAAVTSGDLATAQLVIAAQGAMVAKAKVNTVEIDYAGLVRGRVHALLLAADLIMSGEVDPEGVPSDVKISFDDDLTMAMRDKMADLFARFGADEAGHALDEGRKIATQKLAAGRPAPRKSGGVAGHIEDVYATLDKSQFLTVSAIAKIHTDTYGSDLPSTGAVAARLDAATFQSDGVTPYAKGEKLPDGTTAPAAGAWFEVA